MNLMVWGTQDIIWVYFIVYGLPRLRQQYSIDEFNQKLCDIHKLIIFSISMANNVACV